VGARAGRPGASRQLVGLVGYALALPTLLLGLAAIVLLASGRRRGQPA
jgi:hypothetical protein